MADPVATVEKLVKIGLKIKDAVDTVRYNEEECARRSRSACSDLALSCHSCSRRG